MVARRTQRIRVRRSPRRTSVLGIGTARCVRLITSQAGASALSAALRRSRRETLKWGIGCVGCAMHITTGARETVLSVAARSLPPRDTGDTRSDLATGYAPVAGLITSRTSLIASIVLIGSHSWHHRCSQAWNSASMPIFLRTSSPGIGCVANVELTTTRAAPLATSVMPTSRRLRRSKEPNKPNNTGKFPRCSCHSRTFTKSRPYSPRLPFSRGFRQIFVLATGCAPPVRLTTTVAGRSASSAGQSPSKRRPLRSNRSKHPPLRTCPPLRGSCRGSCKGRCRDNSRGNSRGRCKGRCKGRCQVRCQVRCDLWVWSKVSTAHR
mmetsp:Transcript_21731/g.40712  ORF Transcript_21731/g.40712 Transcript_21731/m.40712 type:complete len:323 (-) Transcript_21731:738-1706(-)